MHVCGTIAAKLEDATGFGCGGGQDGHDDQKAKSCPIALTALRGWLCCGALNLACQRTIGNCLRSRRSTERPSWFERTEAASIGHPSPLLSCSINCGRLGRPQDGRAAARRAGRPNEQFVVDGTK